MKSNVHDMFDMVEEKYSFCNGQNPTPKDEIKSSGRIKSKCNATPKQNKLKVKLKTKID